MILSFFLLIFLLPIISGDLTATYFPNTGFGGESIQKIDPTINFAWNKSSPLSPPFPSSNYTVRWRGTLSIPQNDTLTFSILSDDGIHLWINDHLRYPFFFYFFTSQNVVLVIVDFVVSSVRELKGIEGIPVVVGDRLSIQVEYLHTGKMAPSRIALMWEGENMEKQVIPAKYLESTLLPGQKERYELRDRLSQGGWNTYCLLFCFLCFYWFFFSVGGMEICWLMSTFQQDFLSHF